jgi:hypothetical protein
MWESYNNLIVLGSKQAKRPKQDSLNRLKLVTFMPASLVFEKGMRKQVHTCTLYPLKESLKKIWTEHLFQQTLYSWIGTFFCTTNIIYIFSKTLYKN